MGMLLAGGVQCLNCRGRDSDKQREYMRTIDPFQQLVFQEYRTQWDYDS